MTDATVVGYAFLFLFGMTTGLCAEFWLARRKWIQSAGAFVVMFSIGLIFGMTPPVAIQSAIGCILLMWIGIILVIIGEQRDYAGFPNMYTDVYLRFWRR